MPLHATNHIRRYNVNIGCDPELFLERDGKVIGSERVIPEGGLDSLDLWRPTKVVRDGIQIELHPGPSTCRAGVGAGIKHGMMALLADLKAKNFEVSFKTVVDVPKEELEGLSENSRVLGCLPSKNHYDSAAKLEVGRDFTKRSAGGHIHLGFTGYGQNDPCKCLLDNRERLVPILDAIVGNTCVMIDRDPYAASRRQEYGRAGEFRTPSYGLEYRTPSNFWLRSYQLASLVWGLSKIATCIPIHHGL